jgi:CBS domain-containing protein
MSIVDFCNRTVVCARPDTTILEASALMRQQHVGDILVVEEQPGRRRPVGIVTDRDIVVEVVSAGLDPTSVKLGDLLLRPLVTVKAHAGYAEAIELMTRNGVRRMPIVDNEGMLVGIITLDDLLQQLGTQIARLTKIPGWERTLEGQTRR